MTSEKTWYPTFMIDEVLPTGKPSPEAWLPFLTTASAGQKPLFRPGEELSFRYVEQRGNIEISVNPDGTHGNAPRCVHTIEMFETSQPQTHQDQSLGKHEANSFWEYESEIWAETLDEFARIYAECHREGEPQSVVIDTSYWSPKFHYRISDDCKSLIQQPANDAESAEE